MTASDDDRLDDDDFSPLPPDPGRVVARLYPSAARRVLAAGVLGVLGVILVWVAMAHPPQGLGWRLFLLVLGAFILWGMVRMWQATALGLELTGEELRDTEGRVIARLDEMQAVSRGVFAFKPSNGFLVTTRQNGPAAWAPGLWWRMGRRIGVGGVTGRAEARFMADVLDELLSRRA